MTDLEITLQILAEQQEWNAIIFEAYAARCDAGLFGSWADGAEWLRAVPKLAPPRAEQAAWAVREARVTGVLDTPTVRPVRPSRKARRHVAAFFTPRQLEIAIAALDAIERRTTNVA
ncbi:hypothetical protein BH09ACT9_BH09ACT9_00320 [soil metagenome]